MPELAGSGRVEMPERAQAPRGRWLSPWALTGILAAAALVVAVAWLREPAGRPETIASSDAPSPAMMSLSINFLAANWAALRRTLLKKIVKIDPSHFMGGTEEA